MRTDRDLENDQAIGGMRNPKTSLKTLPKSVEIGKAISIFLRDAAMHPSVQGTVDDLMSCISWTLNQGHFRPDLQKLPRP